MSSWELFSLVVAVDLILIAYYVKAYLDGRK